MLKALIIIDVQNDYFPNGKCELYQSEATLEKIKHLLKHFRENRMPVYYIQHISSKGAAFFEPNTKGVEIHQAITPLSSEKVIIKHAPNSFFKTTLQEELKSKDIEELVICGMMTHMCVDTTVRAAKDLGYRVTLISNACTTKDSEWNQIKTPASVVQQVFMASLNQKFADIMTDEEFLKKS